MKQSDQDIQDGTIGFDPKLAGHAKAHHSHTSSFGRGLPGKLPVPNRKLAGQEEGGRPRQPSTSTTGRTIGDVSDRRGSRSEDPARKEEKRDKQLSRHDEEIGGA